MKRSFFNARLYADGLLQLRTLGILYGALSVVISLATVAVRYYGIRWGGGVTVWLFYPSSIASITPVLLAFIYVGGVSLVMKAFSFLHSRAASDCWHSLPDTRACTAVSLTAAALTWLYGIILVTVMLTWAGYAVTGWPVNACYIPYLLPAYAAGATLVAGAALLGVSATGTAFSGLIVTGLILFLPRFILLLYAKSVSAAAPIAYLSDMGFFLNPAYNLPAALPLAMIDTVWSSRILEMGESDLLIFKGGIAYTAALGAVMLALGVGLYRFRRSETAGLGAPNRALQHIYRCALTLPILLVGALLHIIGYLNAAGWAIIALLSLTVYFCYELITTRRARNLLTAAPLYLAVVALAVGFGLAAQAAGRAVLHDIPEAREVVSVSLYVDDASNICNYNELLSGKIMYTDPQIAEILIDGLEKTVEWVDSDYKNGYRGVSADYQFRLTGGGTLTRRVTLTAEKYEELTALQLACADYRESYRALPPDDTVSYIGLYGLDDETKRRVWDLFRQEAAALTDAQFADVAGTGLYEPTSSLEAIPAETATPDGLDSDADGIYCYTTFKVYGNVGTDGYVSTYKLTDWTPGAAALYMAEINRASRDNMRAQLGYVAAFDPAAAGNDDFYSVNIILHNNGMLNARGQSVDELITSEYLAYYSEATMSASDTERLLSIVADAMESDAVPGRPFMIVSVNTPLDSQSGFSDVYLAVTDEQTAALLALLGDR